MDFAVDKIEELVDGRVFVEWTTVADDGLPLTEGDFFDIVDDETIEDCVTRNVAAKKLEREQFNLTPPRNTTRQTPPRKRTTAVLSRHRTC